MSFGGLTTRRPARRADDDHPLVPFLTRLVRPTQEAMLKVTDYYNQELILAGAMPWTAPLPLMTVMHGNWLIAVQRQMMQRYIEAAIKMIPRKADVPPDIVTFVKTFLNRLDDLELTMVKFDTQRSQGVKFALAEMAKLPTFPSKPQLSYAVWCAYGVLHEQLRLDQSRVTTLGVPHYMQSIQKELNDELIPTYKQFDLVRARVTDSPTVDQYDEAIVDARPLAEMYFVAGQALWAPYLLGDSYRSAMNYKPTLDDLNFGFDVWYLTDPSEVTQRKTDAKSREALLSFWSSVKQPIVAAQLQAQLLEAERRKAIRYTDQRHSQAPWQSIYLVRFPMTFGPRTFVAGDLIVLIPKEIPGGYEIEVRRTGHLSHPLDRLGQR